MLHVVLNLPVEAAIGLLEAPVRGAGRLLQRAIRRKLQGAGEEVDVAGEFLVDATFEAAGEQRDEDEGGERHSQKHACRGETIRKAAADRVSQASSPPIR